MIQTENVHNFSKSRDNYDRPEKEGNETRDITGQRRYIQSMNISYPYIYYYSRTKFRKQTKLTLFEEYILHSSFIIVNKCGFTENNRIIRYTHNKGNFLIPLY